MNVRINKIAETHFKGDLNKTKNDFVKILYALTVVAVGSQLMFDYVFAVKAVLIFGLSAFISRETEIFFITQKFGVMRPEAVGVVKETKPEITGLIFALLLPVGTPLFVVAIGAFVSVFIGKMVYGGYSFNVFNPAIIGRLFVGIAWPALVKIEFPAAFDNYILELMFQRDLSQQLLSPLMEIHNSGIVSLAGVKTLTSVLVSPNHGMLLAVPAVVYLALIPIFAWRKTVDLKPLVVTTFTSIIVLTVVALGFNLSIGYVVYHLVAGGFLFVSLFMMTDPFTKPYSLRGLVYYSTIFTVVFTLVRFLGKDADGVLYALLFANLFVPLLNKKTIDIDLGKNRQTVIALVSTVIVLIVTGLFINKVLGQRIENSEIVVSSYVEN